MIWLMEILKICQKKILRDKAFNIAKNQKYDEYQRSFASMLYKFFDKETSESGDNNEIKRNLQF